MFSLKDLNELLDKMPLWKRMKESPDRIDLLEKRIKAIEDQISGTADVCPYCRKPTGQLIDIRDDEHFKMAGLKREFYKCSSCHKEYDREQPLQH